MSSDKLVAVLYEQVKQIWSRDDPKFYEKLEKGVLRLYPDQDKDQLHQAVKRLKMKHREDPKNARRKGY